MLFRKNLLLEFNAVADFHELVGVAGVTIFACELAAAIRIDCPGEGHLTTTIAAVQQRLHRQCEVFDFVPLADTFTMRGEACNSHQARA